MAFGPTDHMSRFQKCRYYCRTGATFLFSHIGLCGLVFGYTLVGAIAFETLEAGYETEKRREMGREPSKVVEHLWELTEGAEVLNESWWSENATLVLRGLETRLVQAMRKEGYDGNEETDNLQWSFSGALLYSIIVITTIGYGNIAPKTDTGKIVTILYAIVGIPLLLLCLSNIGDAMAHSFKFIYWKVCCYLCSNPKTSQGNRRTRSTRISSRYPSEPRTMSVGLNRREVDSLGRPVYRTPTDSFDRHHQRGYMSSGTLPQPMSRNHSYYSPREQAEFTDANKVPIISNKYALYPTDRADLPHPRHHPLHHGPQYRGAAAIVRQPGNAAGRPEPFDDPSMSYEVSSLDSSNEDQDQQEEEEASVPIMLCISIVVGYICGGAVLFSYWEGWDYSDSCYFCFITLTTIGFGDMVPGGAVLSDDAQLALGLCSLYLLFGMALLAMSFNLVQEEVTKSMTSIGRRIGILSDEDDEDEDDVG